MRKAMKKKALKKEFRMEIKKSLNRFLSIFFIVAMGVAFFTGIQASAPDMRVTEDSYFDNSSLMDFRVIGTMGLTQGDLEALGDIDDIEYVEGCYMEDVYCGEDDAKEVLHVESLPEKVNQVTAEAGSLPTKPGECFLDAEYAQKKGYEPGDVIEITVSSEEDSSLRHRKYTVSGCGSSPAYIAFERGTTTLGTGSVSGFAYVVPEEFDAEVYSVAYLLAAGAREKMAYTEEYDNLIDQVYDRIDGISDARCEIRYDEVMADATETLDDAKKEVEDGKQELEDAKQELTDAESEAESELSEAESELTEGEAELADGKQELEDARAEVENGEKELADGEQEITDNEVTLDDARSQIAQARAQLNEGESEYQAGLKEYKKQSGSAQKELDAAQKQIDQGREQVESGWQEYNQNLAVIEDGESQLAAAEQQLAEGQAAFDASYESTKAQLDAGQAQYDAGAAQLAEGQAAYEQGASELAAQQQAYGEARMQLDQGWTQYQSGMEQLAAGQAEYDSAASKVDQLRSQYEAAAAKVTEVQNAYDAAAAGAQQLREAYEAEPDRIAALQSAYENDVKTAASLRTQQKTAETAKKDAEAAAQAKAEEKEAKAQEKTSAEKELSDVREQIQASTDETEKEKLLQRQTELESRIDTLSGEIQALEGSISDLNGQAAARGQEAASAADQAAAIESGLGARKQEIDNANASLPAMKQAADDAAAALPGMQAALESASAGSAELKAAYDNASGQLAQQKKLLDDTGSQLAAVKADLDQKEAGMSEWKSQLDAGASQLAAQKQTMDAAQQQLAATKQQLDDGYAQLAAAKAELEAGKAELEQKKAQLASGRAALEEAKSTLETSEKQLKASQKKVDDGKAELEQAKKKLTSARRELDLGWAKLNASQAQLADGERQLSDARTQLSDARSELADARQQIADAEKEIAENEQKLKDGWEDYEEGRQEAQEKIDEARQKIEDAEKELLDAEKEIADAEKELADLRKPRWYVDDRTALPDNLGYGENADRMSNLAQVFPVIFFLVAALISLTTMTRMVEEERTQIGTMKALGYSKLDIAGKYMKYAFLATIGGSVFGTLFGEKIFPWVIINAYGIMYQHQPEIIIPYNLKFAVIATGAALFCTLGATLAACYRELQEVPAQLMRPPAPKDGKRVFLEHLPFLWRRIGFTWKATIRNLVRYKKRFFMTIIGIGGCMGLLLVGYGLRDSIMDIGRLQFSELQMYDAMVVLDTDSPKEEQDEVYDMVAGDSRISASGKFYMQRQEVRTGEKTGKEWAAYVYVPEHMESADDFLCFRKRGTEETYELTNEGAIITEKIAKELGIEAGDTIVLEQEDGDAVTIPIADICENYLYHYIYLSPVLYEQIYGEAPEYNSIFFRSPGEEDEVEEIGGKLLVSDAVLNITYTRTMEAQVDNMLGALDLVIIVLIISAGMLAFVVLYNLNNININERRRELATLKVLGFYNGEVASYVYRENILLTVIGAALGILIGKVLHMYIITTVEVDTCMFGRNINLQSFVIGTLFTCLFSIIVNFAMYFKLRKIDMVESLKSIE